MRNPIAKSHFTSVGARFYCGAFILPLFLLGVIWMVQTKSVPAQSVKSIQASQASSKRITTRGINIVDESGQTRITLSAQNGSPQVLLRDASGKERLSVSLDQAGHGSISLKNPNATGPTAALEIDDKGAHVKFDRPGGASSYLFLNNSGESGTVFLDANGTRKLDLLVTPSGTTEIHRYDRESPTLP